MFGIPVCGKGSTSKAILFALERPGHILEARQLIGRKKEQDPAFNAMATPIQKLGDYLDDGVMHNEVLVPMFEYPEGVETLFLDGLGRTPEQLKKLLAFLASRSLPKPYGVFFRMTEEESIPRFQQTLNAEDRQGREDGLLGTHVKRVRTHLGYEDELMRIMQSTGCASHQLNAVMSLEERARSITRYFDIPINTARLEDFCRQEEEKRQRRLVVAA